MIQAVPEERVQISRHGWIKAKSLRKAKDRSVKEAATT